MKYGVIMWEPLKRRWIASKDDGTTWHDLRACDHQAQKRCKRPHDAQTPASYNGVYD